MWDEIQYSLNYVSSYPPFNVFIAIVTGQVLRQTRSTVHLKVDDVLRIHDARIEDNAILRIQSNQKLAKHQKYALKIERRNSQHTLVDVLPFTSGIDMVIASYCQ